MAQLAERSPTIPEDPGSNPVIGNFYLNIYLLLTVCRKDENKEKEAENGPFKKKLLVNTTAYHLGQHCCSSPSTKELHGMYVMVHLTNMKDQRVAPKVLVALKCTLAC